MAGNEEFNLGKEVEIALKRVALKKCCEVSGVPKKQWRLMDILVKNGAEPLAVMDSINEWIDEIAPDEKTKPEVEKAAKIENPQKVGQIPQKATREEIDSFVEMLRNSGFKVEVISVGGDNDE